MSNENHETIGLSLSGGGFRATLFNLGAIWRLNDAGWLPKLDRIASVSGGSITAAVLGHRWHTLQFHRGSAGNFREIIATPIQKFCQLSIDVPSLMGLINPFGKVADSVARRYDNELFDGGSLADLPDDNRGEGPRFILYATNLQTGVSFRFSRPYMADWRLGMYDAPEISLAQAVAASSAFPPVLSPVVLKTDPSRWHDGASDVPDLAKLRQRIVLTDGGVYDNMGLEAVWDRCDVVLVSDAGGPFVIKTGQRSFWRGQLTRVRNIMMEQTRALRRRMVMQELTSGRKRGGFWATTTKINDYELEDAMARDSQRSSALQHIRTRLNPFSQAEQGELINWAYALTDATLRKYLDPTIPKGKWPIPEHAL